MIDQSFLNSVVARIVANYEPDRVLLFGSQARNSVNEASDIDLLIIKHTTVPMWRRGRNVQALFANSPVKLDLLFYTPKEIEEERARPHSFVNMALASAQVLYSRTTTLGVLAESINPKPPEG